MGYFFAHWLPVFVNRQVNSWLKASTGMGIDLSRKSRHVFGLYKRFHPHIEGRGVGLFMVKTQIEALSGRISINSEPGKGTEFRMVLPVE